MAVKAVACPLDIERHATNNTHINIAVKVSILGSDLGEFSAPDYTLPVEDVNPTAVSVLDTAIQEAVQADLELHEVEFGPLDVVLVYR